MTVVIDVINRGPGTFQNTFLQFIRGDRRHTTFYITYRYAPRQKKYLYVSDRVHIPEQMTSDNFSRKSTYQFLSPLPEYNYIDQ